MAVTVKDKTDYPDPLKHCKSTYPRHAVWIDKSIKDPCTFWNFA